MGATCLTKRVCAPCGAQTRRSTEAIPRAIEARISRANSSAIRSGWGMRSTVPSKAEAIRRTSPTCQRSPRPRQSHWKNPVAP